MRGCERLNFLTSLSVFYVAAFVLTYCIATFKNIRIPKTPLYALTAVFILALSVIAFFTKPYEGDDLTFYYELLGDMRQNGLMWTLKDSIYASDVVINLYYYLIARTGVFQLLPAVSVAIIYTLFFSMLYQIQDRYQTPSYSLLFFFFVHFSFLFFRWTLSGIRNYLAFALFAYALMREFVLHKRGPLNWVLYLMATFTHFSLAFFLVIRLLCIRPIYDFLRRFKYVLAGWGILSGVLARLLVLVPIGIIQKIGSKITDYFLFMQFDMRKVLLRFVLFLVLLLMYGLLHKYHKSAMAGKERYYQFLEIAMLLILGSIFIPLLFDRCVGFLLFMAYPLFADYFSSAEKRSRYLIFALLAVPSLVMAGIQVIDAVNYWFFFA